MHFWVAEDVSSIPGFDLDELAGDGRDVGADPMSPHLSLDDSRMTVVIDHESGRGMVTVSPTSVRVMDVPGSLDSLLNDPFWQRGTQFDDILTVPARPIVLGPNSGLTSGVHNNYFQMDSNDQTISVDYNAINKLTAPLHVISVDGPLVITTGPDGLFGIDGSGDPDAYPSMAIEQ